MADPVLTIPKDVIDPIVQAHVNKAVIEALNGHDKIVSSAILAILNMKVDSNGKPSNYGSDRDRTWIDWVVGDCIQKAARAAIEEHLTKNQEQVKKFLVKELGAKNSKLARQLAEGMIGAVTSPDFMKYRISVTFDK